MSKTLTFQKAVESFIYGADFSSVKPDDGVSKTWTFEPTSVIYHPEKSVISESALIGEGCTIHAPVWIGPDVVIGSGTRVQAFAFIPTGVTIANDCFIGPHVCFTNDKHPPSDRSDWLPTVVEDGVSIGAGAIILPGITLGRGCRIAAGAVVTKDVAPGELSFGAR